jgi:hypothetical protein
MKYCEFNDTCYRKIALAAQSANYSKVKEQRLCHGFDHSRQLRACELTNSHRRAGECGEIAYQLNCFL